METTTRQRNAAWRRHLGRAALLVPLALASGCALFHPDRAGPLPWKPEPKGSTIGTDPNTVPNGHVIPPPSLGVDLTALGTARFLIA